MLKIPSDNMMNKLFVLLVISLTIMNGMALQIRKDSTCPTPLIFESINGFKLPVDDIAQLLANQFSHNNLSNINAANKVYLTNIVYQSRLLSQDQSQSYPTPLSANIFNDKIQFEIDYKIMITQGTIPKNKTFVAKTKISNIIIIYQKDYVLENSSFLISKVNVKLDTSMFKTTYDQQPNQKQTDSFNAAITGNATSLFTTFSKLFSTDDVARYMQSNTKKQPLSVVYKENPYNYKFDNGFNLTITIPVDVTTTWFNASSQKQLTNGISGMLPNANTQCSNFVPNFSQHGGQLFITKQFIQNFIGYNLMAFNGWQQIKIDKTTIRSTLLQWQLLDLDYVVDNLWTDLYMVSQNQIYFTCSAQQNLANKLIDNKGPKLHQTLKWACNGFVKLNQTASQKVIEFYPTINHITDLQIYQGSIKPYVNVLQFIDWQFKDVPSMNGQTVYKVNPNNMRLAQKLIESVFNDFRTYPVGHRFWVGEKATRIQIEDQAKGIWIL